MMVKGIIVAEASREVFEISRVWFCPLPGNLRPCKKLIGRNGWSGEVAAAAAVAAIL